MFPVRWAAPTMTAKERRKQKRYYIKALLRLAEAGEYSNITLEAINLSAGGLFFRSNTKIDVGAELNLLFSLPDFSKPIEVRCTSVHSVETVPGKQYFVGVEFQEIKGTTRKELQKFLEEKFGGGKIKA
jgi:c-di-GMP-binding flagellar brake protein YcgR